MQVGGGRKAYDDINITPMLDLAYVLLVIFILMATASVQGIKVDLPKASTSQSLAQPKTIALMRAYHSNSGMSVMTMAAATASLLDTANLEKNRTANREVRKLTVDAFTSGGYRVAHSDANFVFVDIKRESKGFQEACRQQGVAVGRAFPPMTTWARISIGTQAEMEKAIPVFMKVLSAPPLAQTASYEHLDSLPSELT